MKDLIKDFLVASSIFVCVTPYMYIGEPYKNGKTLGIPFHIIAIFLPFYYGFMNVILREQPYYIRGAIIGFVLSIIGRMQNAPSILFGMKTNINLIHIYAIITYALIFQFPVKSLRELI